MSGPTPKMSHAATDMSTPDGQSSALALALCSPLVAALFVQPDGCYSKLENVDLWPAERDARLYSGPLPVVAHPPCQLWVNFAALNFKRYGGEHNRPGNDGGCFAAALAAVRKWGGVLEHPAFSNAWKAFDLEAPRGSGWQRIARREWVCEVWQSAYGHKARKRTWLFYSGVENPVSAISSRIRKPDQVIQQWTRATRPNTKDQPAGEKP